MNGQQQHEPSLTGPRFTEPGTLSQNGVTFKQPPRIRRPKHKRMEDLRVAGPRDFLGMHHWNRRRNVCVRTSYCAAVVRSSDIPDADGLDCSTIDYIRPDDLKDMERQRFATGSSAPAEKSWIQTPYVVVGVMGITHRVPCEILVTINKPMKLFKKIHDAERQMILSELYLDYVSGEPDYGDRWLNWIQQELNMGHSNPADGKYSLQLLLKWSPPKIVLWGSISVLLSLAVGFWYEFSGGRFPGAQASDIIGITQTAWTISSYILTAAGVLIALLAAITQVGET